MKTILGPSKRLLTPTFSRIREIQRVGRYTVKRVWMLMFKRSWRKICAKLIKEDKPLLELSKRLKCIVSQPINFDVIGLIFIRILWSVGKIADECRDRGIHSICCNNLH